MASSLSAPAELPEIIAWADVFIEMREQAASGNPVQALVCFVGALRPAGKQDPVDQIRSLLDYLEMVGVEEGRFLGQLLRQQLREVHYVHALTDAGIPSSYQGFWSELVRRISHRFLPDVEDPESLTVLLQTVFDHEDDYEWIGQIPPGDWVRLLDAMGITRVSVSEVPAELASALLILAHHVASLGLQPEITERLSYLEGPASPFLAISASVLRYLDSYEEASSEDRDARLAETLARLAECREAVRTLRAEKDLFGTSLRLTILSVRLQVQIERLDVLLHLSSARDFQRSALGLLQALVRAVNTRHHMLPHLRQSADLLAYQVVEFAARKGSRYITRSPREYVAFLLSSMGGGLIVAVFALVKVLLDTLEVSLTAEAVLYGINYSICFVLIYLTGATLATKQPAMTANTIAHSLGDTEEHNMASLQELVVRTWRSQFISFMGNLMMAFPVALLLARGFQYLTGSFPASVEKSAKLLEGLHPWQSGALAYAAVAGVFLFAAGLVSGYVDNRNRYARISQRIARHPLLLRLGGSGLAERMAAFVDNNLGIVVGNVFLGFCLGSSGTVGEILGLPFDIRHIAFASAHFGVAVEGLGWSISRALMLEITLGVMLIGLVNFLVSFGLSLSLAMESRQVTFREGRVLARGLLRHLIKRPLDYFIPPRRRRLPGS